MLPPGWMNWLKYPRIPRTASPPAAAAATPGPPAIDAWDTRLVIRIASNAESGESSPVPCSARPTSLPMTPALRTVLTTWKISLKDMWFSLAEQVWLHNVGDRQILRNVFRNFLRDQLAIERGHDHRVPLAGKFGELFLHFCFLTRLLRLQLLLPPSPS